MSFPVQVFRCSHLWPPGVSGPGPAASLPVPVPAGLHRPAGLPAAAVCHRVRRAEAHRPGWREPEGDGLSDGRRLHAAVSAAKLLSALLGSGLVWASEREEEHLQRLQVLHKHFALTVDVWSIENRLSWHLTEGSKDKQVEKWIRIYWVWGFMGHPRSKQSEKNHVLPAWFDRACLPWSVPECCVSWLAAGISSPTCCLTRPRPGSHTWSTTSWTPQVRTGLILTWLTIEDQKASPSIMQASCIGMPLSGCLL